MLRADNDNGPTLRLTTDDGGLRARIDAFQSLVGVDDEAEFLELALSAYEDAGFPAHDGIATRLRPPGSLTIALPLSDAARHSLTVARMRTGLNEEDIAMRAMAILLGYCDEAKRNVGETKARDA